ncbi:MAG: hypothetical protein RIK87_16680 [Fuerstiella sp.]
MKTFRNLVCLTLIAVISGVGVADEKQKKGKGKRGARTPSVTQRLVAKIELSDEQKEQVAAIDKQFAARAKELAGKRRDILTADQRKAQVAAQKAAKEAGQKGAEARKAVDAALNLTEAQKAQQKELNKAQQALNAEVVVALKKVLTAEQQAQLPKQRGNAKGKAGARKKAGADGQPKKKKTAE